MHLSLSTETLNIVCNFATVTCFILTDQKCNHATQFHKESQFVKRVPPPDSSTIVERT